MAELFAALLLAVACLLPAPHPSPDADALLAASEAQGQQQHPLNTPEAGRG